LKTILYAVGGILLGLWAGEAGGQLLGAIAGAAIGVLLGRVAQLEAHIREANLRSTSGRVETAPGEVAERGSDWKAPQAPFAQPPASTESVDQPQGDAGEDTFAADEHVRRREFEPSLLQQGWAWCRTWLTRGNVPVKVGVIISFFGFAFLLKYAVDRELIFLPLAARLAGVALFGLVLLVIGWRLRQRTRTYALSLQGGGLGILFLTVFSAFRVWALLSPPVAFSLLVILAFATGVLALVQNARTLAIFGTVGGFLAPVLASTGQGSHVALFSYYLVINGAVLGLAWFRAWRDLNLVGWAFTFVIGWFWGYHYYRPEYFNSTEPFLVIYFLVYNAIAVLFALRQPPDRIGLVDGSLVFGTPAVVFASQAALISDSDYGLAWSALALAAFYALTALALWRRKGKTLRLLVESYQALSVVFLTLAIPLALDARWTAGAWALEGAALVWIGMRQSHHLANLAGTLLVFGAGLAFIDDGWKSGRGLAVLNGNVLGGLLVSLSAFFASRQLGHYERHDRFERKPFQNAYWLASFSLFLWGAAWWVGTGFLEVLDRTTRFGERHVFLLFLATSTMLAGWVGQRLEWRFLLRSGLALLPFLGLIGWYDFISGQHFLYGLGWLAWPLAWIVHGWCLYRLDETEEVIGDTWHLLSALLLAVFLAAESWWQVAQAFTETWATAAATSLAGLVPWLVWLRRARSRWPVNLHQEAYFEAAILIVSAQLLSLSLYSMANPGDPDPLPYIPLLNPFDLSMFAVGAVAWQSLRIVRTQRHWSPQTTKLYSGFLALVAFVVTTAALVRGVHHYAGTAWQWNALFDSVLVQTSLSIYWGILGFAGMLLGARGGRRTVWLGGAAFMALVVVKLFAVDLTQTGTVERIISFIGVGLLLLVVGYFAPVPPRAAGGNPDHPREAD
jgi:uncharacterized membrane protein